MARIEVEITGNISGLRTAFNQAQALSNGFSNRVASSASGAAAGLGAVQAEADQVGRSFSTLNSAPFTFGVNATRAATQTTGALNRVQAEVNDTVRSFRLLNNAPFTFGVNLVNATRPIAPALNDVNRSLRTSGVQFQGFSRVLQDVAFGPGAIANNLEGAMMDIRQLGQISRDTGQSIGRVLVNSLAGGGGLNLALGGLTLALSLASFGISAWTRLFPNAKKATDDASDAAKEYADTLEAVRGASLKGAQNAQEDVAQLQILYKATQDTTKSLSERKGAVDELQRIYPAYFQNLKDEEILNGNAVNVYNKVRDAILATAQARSVEAKIAEKSSAILENYEKNLDLVKKLTVAQNALDKANKNAEKRETRQGVSGQTQALDLYDLPIRKSERERNAIAKEINDNAAKSASLQEEINHLLDYGVAIQGKGLKNTEQGNAALQQAVNINELLLKLQQDAILSSLTGADKEVQASNFKYDELRRQADQYYKDGKLKAKEYYDYIARLQGGRIGAAGTILQNAGAIKSAPINDPNPSRGQGQVVPVNLTKPPVIDLTTDPVWDAFVDDLDKQLGRSVQNFGRDFMRTLSTINQQADATFQGVVGSLIGNLTGGLNEVLNTTLLKGLEDTFSSAFKDMGEGLTKVVAGIGIAGSAISGITSRTSSLGQGLGGALSGAAAGSFLGPVGSIVGGVVGAIGGLFGASSARKQEQLQAEQLKEQQKTNDLLERQNALSYASSIIGQQTTAGIVTGIIRDAFGNLSATVSGDSLQFVLARSGGQR